MMRFMNLNRLAFCLVSLLAVFGTSNAVAQDEDISNELQCLRYLQTYERGLRIPSGLLTAVSMAEAGRPVGENNSLVAWPWTINVGGRGQFFETKDEAVAAVRKLLDSGQRSIDVGCMQINLRYHPDAFQTIEDAFDPATNVAYGAKFLSELHGLQGTWPKAVERYHSAEDGRREQYRERVLALWNSEARRVVMNAVMAEDTDTPYHRAIRDFAAGKYDAALDKYQAIVDANPKDRIGLLGVAMSYEELGRETEAMQAYARYLAIEPSNQNILAKAIHKASAKDPASARDALESILKAGVSEPDLYAALAEIATTQGDTNAAFSYASDAAHRAPGVPTYQLNAGVLADKLNRPAAAVQFYEQFLSLFQRQPSLVDVSLDSVRDRVKFLRARL